MVTDLAKAELVRAALVRTRAMRATKRAREVRMKRIICLQAKNIVAVSPNACDSGPCLISTGGDLLKTLGVGSSLLVAPLRGRRERRTKNLYGKFTPVTKCMVPTVGKLGEWPLRVVTKVSRFRPRVRGRKRLIQTLYGVGKST